MAIDHIVHKGFAFNELGEDIRALQHIDVIVRSTHTEESMPNPEILICHCLKHHSASSIMTFVHSLTNKWTFLSCPMHIIDASKHPR